MHFSSDAGDNSRYRQVPPAIREEASVRLTPGEAVEGAACPYCATTTHPRPSGRAGPTAVIPANSPTGPRHLGLVLDVVRHSDEVTGFQVLSPALDGGKIICLPTAQPASGPWLRSAHRKQRHLHPVVDHPREPPAGRSTPAARTCPFLVHQPAPLHQLSAKDAMSQPSTTAPRRAPSPRFPPHGGGHQPGSPLANPRRPRSADETPPGAVPPEECECKAEHHYARARSGLTRPTNRAALAWPHDG